MIDPLSGTYQRLTPPGVGGIHVFALAGPHLNSFLDTHFLAKGQGRKELMFGHLVDGEDFIDEVIIHHRSGRLDLSIHGSIAVEKRVIELLESIGFVKGDISEPNRKYGGSSAIFDEADACLRAAVSPHAVLFFLAVLEGGLTREIAGWIATLAPGEAEHEARRIGVESAIDSLLKRAEFGLAMSTPPAVVLAGGVNTGKSTLFNALLEKERAIVADVAGTTRDVIEAPLELDGYPFSLVDTAGQRQTDHEIEGLGVTRAKNAQSRASIVIQVQTAATYLAGTETQIEGELGAQQIFVASKVDELDAAGQSELARQFPQLLAVSSNSGVGLDELRRLIIFRSPFAGPAVREFPCPFTERQVQLLDDAQAILPHDPSAAADLLQQLLKG